MVALSLGVGRDAIVGVGARIGVGFVVISGMGWFMGFGVDVGWGFWVVVGFGMGAGLGVDLGFVVAMAAISLPYWDGAVPTCS